MRFNRRPLSNIIIGVPGDGPWITIGSGLPAELIAFFLTFQPLGEPETAVNGTIFYDAVNDYQWDILVIAPTFGAVRSVGRSISGVLVEVYRIVNLLEAGETTLQWTNFEPQNLISPAIQVTGGALGLRLNTDAFFYIGNVSQPRGLVAGSFVLSTANTAAITTGTALQSGTCTFQNGRAFKIVHRTSLIGSVAGAQANVFFRAGTLAPTGSTVYGPVRSQSQLTVSPGQYQQFEAEFVNTTGSDIVGTCAIVLTNTSGTCTEIADATKPRYMYVEDIGAATDYPGLISAS